MSSDEKKTAMEKKEENVGVIVADKIPDTRLKVHIGNLLK